jgi:hypothetical protein
LVMERTSRSDCFDVLIRRGRKLGNDVHSSSVTAMGALIRPAHRPVHSNIQGSPKAAHHMLGQLLRSKSPGEVRVKDDRDAAPPICPLRRRQLEPFGPHPIFRVPSLISHVSLLTWHQSAACAISNADLVSLTCVLPRLCITSRPVYWVNKAEWSRDARGTTLP